MRSKDEQVVLIPLHSVSLKGSVKKSIDSLLALSFLVQDIYSILIRYLEQITLGLDLERGS